MMERTKVGIIFGGRSGEHEVSLQSARSIMAEALLNQIGGGRFRAFSAGSHPALEVHPFALRTMATMHLPTEGYRSKDWAEFAAPDAPKLDFVFTVCDKAAGERCPFWPGQPMTAHWGVSDPAAFEGTDEDKARHQNFVKVMESRLKAPEKKPASP